MRSGKIRLKKKKKLRSKSSNPSPAKPVPSSQNRQSVAPQTHALAQASALSAHAIAQHAVVATGYPQSPLQQIMQHAAIANHLSPQSNPSHPSLQGMPGLSLDTNDPRYAALLQAHQAQVLQAAQIQRFRQQRALDAQRVQARSPAFGATGIHGAALHLSPARSSNASPQQVKCVVTHVTSTYRSAKSQNLVIFFFGGFFVVSTFLTFLGTSFRIR